MTRVALAALVLAAGTVTGCGTGATRHHAPTPRPAAPAHVATWALDDGCNGGAGASGRLVRRWVTFAETNCGPRADKARHDCHVGGRSVCRVMQYLDTNWIYENSVGVRAAAAASGGWSLHEPPPHRGVAIFSPAYGGGHLLNQSAPSVRAFFSSYVRQHFDADDGLFMDDQGTSLSQELYYSTCHCTATSELRTNAALVAAHKKMSESLTHRNGAPFLQADNALVPNPYLPEGFGMLSPSTGVEGLVGDGLPEQDGALDPYYSTLLDQMAFTDTHTRGFLVLMSRGSAGAASQSRSRRVQEATILLGFAPRHVVDWANLEDGSRNLAIWPEEGIYPLHPVESMTAPGGPGCLSGTGRVCSQGGHRSLEVAPGIYRREFADCYDEGRPIGPCAAIVNTTVSRVRVRGAWLKLRLAHQIRFAGGDVQNGGRIETASAPFMPGTTGVPAHDAMLLVR